MASYLPRVAAPRRFLLGSLAALAALVVGDLRPAPAAPPRVASEWGPVELELKSELSHIRVRRRDDLRALIFVRDNGDEAVETLLHLKRPYDIQAPYARSMFASYLFRPEPERVLIVGLGGGAMVHFLTHYDPKVQVDAVEIDPAVVKIAAERFGVKSQGNVRVITADALEFLAQTDQKYDVIYMDAFLKPSADTDTTGVPLALKTAEFYKSVHKRLVPQGVMAFNINRHEDLESDLRTVRAAFPQVYVFRVGTTNVVAIGSLDPRRKGLGALREAAFHIDRRLEATFSFRRLLSTMAR